jgi:acetylornithine deacetylase/succinyl-diaminopimelate desuccinylase-like protein
MSDFRGVPREAGKGSAKVGQRTLIGVLLAFLTAAVYPASAQESTGGSATSAAARVAAETRQWRRANEHAIVAELRELLAIPNVATDTANIRRNAEKLREMLARRGFTVRFLEIEDRGPVIVADLAVPGATRTVAFYCHYDGQPVDAVRWIDTRPWEPALRTNSIEAGGRLIPFPAPGTPHQDDWRIYARSASDDKSPIVGVLAALDALSAQGRRPAFNVKFILDGEEEDGSPNLERTLAAHRELVAADLLISADGPVHQSGRPQVVFGNRGIAVVELTAYGPYRPLHSGHYGNWAPNPAMRLAQLLASMKDAEGRVLVEGFYDDVRPLTEVERRALDSAPQNEPDLMREMGFSEAEGAGRRLVELITQPSLNVRGMRSAWVGADARTIVPDAAIASIDLRLVKDIDPVRQVERVAAHIRRQGYHVSDREPTHEERMQHPRIARLLMLDGYPAARTSMDRPEARRLVSIVEAGLGEPLVVLPTSGGSVPMYIFEGFGLPIIHVPTVNHDNNQHSPNENVRLGNFFRGIEIFAAILAELRW